MTSFVYLISDGDLFKIGKATDVSARLRGLQTGTGRTLTVIGLAQGGLEQERSLHASLASYRRQGEWFALPEDVVRALQREVFSLAYEAPAPQRPRPRNHRGEDQKLAKAICAYLLKIHPMKTNSEIERVTGIARDTVKQWYTRNSCPSAENVHTLVLCYGIELFAVGMDVLAPREQWITDIADSWNSETRERCGVPYRVRGLLPTSQHPPSAA